MCTKKVDFKIWVSSFSIHENPIQFAMCVFQLNVLNMLCVCVWRGNKMVHCSIGHRIFFARSRVSAYGKQSISVDQSGKTLESEIHVVFCEAHERKKIMQWFFIWSIHLTQTRTHTQTFAQNYHIRSSTRTMLLPKDVHALDTGLD